MRWRRPGLRRGGGPARAGQGLDHRQHRLVQYEIDTPLTVLARKIGKRDAVARLAALPARGRCARGAARRARHAGVVRARHALSRRRHARCRGSRARARGAARRRARQPHARPKRAARALRHPRPPRCSATATSRSIRARRPSRLLQAAVRRNGARSIAPVDIVEIDASETA